MDQLGLEILDKSYKMTREKKAFLPPNSLKELDDTWV